MSLQTKPKPAHAINPEIVENIASDPEYNVEHQRLTECLNLLQGLAASEYDLATYCANLSRPEQYLGVIDDRAYTLITPVTWWEFQQHTDWSNQMDEAVLEAHRQMLLEEFSTDHRKLNKDRLGIMHPFVTHIEE